jgi:peptide chain release factor 2
VQHSRSSSTSSGPSSTGSGSTFDPATLERRLGELENELNAPGFWDDQSRAAKVSSEHARASRRLEGYRALLRDYADARELAGLDGGEMDDEVAASLAPLRRELEELQEAALFNGEYDAGDAVVTLQSGTGGTDAQDWAEMMLRMYERWAANRGFTVELLEASPGEEAGIKSATFTVGGENAYGILKAERGKHRLVRQSPFDQAHRRHTAFSTVIVAPLLPDDAEVEIDDDDLKIDTYRAQGAGGQHVNKTDSAVRITHLPSGIVVQCQNERSQSANKQTAMRVLKARLVEKVEEEREAVMAKERGGAADTGFGGESVRSYVLHPYQLVKDTRTGYEMGNTQAVLDGELDPFIREYLLARAAGRVV